MSEPTFEQAREELAEIVAKLEAGGLTLEESLALWNRGEEVARVCTEWLEKAQAVLDAAAEDSEDADADAVADTDADAETGAGDSTQE